uniref:F-box domain-containing protein n=1 Tax=Strongyloides papillosus TaxID=174720 RepID=A0A0N5BRU1_STREA
MDSSTEEELPEAPDYTSVLHDDALILILSKLSWMDINNIKLVSRRLYGIVHENCHKLNRREVYDVWIHYYKIREKHRFDLKLGFNSLGDGNLSITRRRYYKEVTKIKSDRELSRFLKMLDMRNLELLSVHDSCNTDIFNILNKSFQIKTNIGYLAISKLTEKDFIGFRKFIKKCSSVTVLDIQHMCFPSTEMTDVYSQLSLSSFNNLESLIICECHETKVLSTDMITRLLRKNLNLTCLNFGSCNIEFLRRASKEINHNDITLRLFFEGTLISPKAILDIFPY